jgi:heat shock protein HslJ
MTPCLSIRAVRLLVAVTLAALVAGGCAVEPPASPIRISHPTSLAGTTWRLVAIEGRRPPAGPDLTLSFEADGRVAGEGACNGFGGSFLYEAASGRLRIADLVSTKRACVEPARNDVEAAYFAALRAVADASGDSEGRLVLTGAGGELVLEVGPRPVGPPIEASPSSRP